MLQYTDMVKTIGTMKKVSRRHNKYIVKHKKDVIVIEKQNNTALHADLKCNTSAVTKYLSVG